MSTEIQNSEGFIPVPDTTDPFAPDFRKQMDRMVNREVAREGLKAMVLTAPFFTTGAEGVLSDPSTQCGIVGATLGLIEENFEAGHEGIGGKAKAIAKKTVGGYLLFSGGYNLISQENNSVINGLVELAGGVTLIAQETSINDIRNGIANFTRNSATTIQNKVFGTPEERQKAEVERYIKGLPEAFRNLNGLSQSKKTNAENYLREGGFSEVDKDNILKSLDIRNPVYQFIKNARNIRCIYSNGNTLLVCNKNYEVKLLSMEQEQQ